MISVGRGAGGHGGDLDRQRAHGVGAAVGVGTRKTSGNKSVDETTVILELAHGGSLGGEGREALGAALGLLACDQVLNDQLLIGDML